MTDSKKHEAFDDTVRAAGVLARSVAAWCVIACLVTGLCALVADEQTWTKPLGPIGFFLLPLAAPGVFAFAFLLVWPPLALATAWRYRSELLGAERVRSMVVTRAVFPATVFVLTVRRVYLIVRGPDEPPPAREPWSDLAALVLITPMVFVVAMVVVRLAPRVPKRR